MTNKARYGFIGTGIIGKMLVDRFLQEGVARPEQILTSNDCAGNKEVIENSGHIYLCVRPQNLGVVLPQLTGNLEDKVLITSVAAVESDAYYQNLGNIQLVRIIPSITNRKRGTILFNSGKFVLPENKDRVYSDLSRIAHVYEVEEAHMDEYTHLASCFPAILAEFTRQYLQSMTRRGIDEEKGRVMLLDTLYETAALLKEQGLSVIDEVCTPGGISRIGVDFVSKNFPVGELSDELLGRMNYVKERFGGKNES